MPKNYHEAIAKLLKSRKKIIVNKRLLTAVGADDYRDFAIMVGTWAEARDFTYQSNLYETSWQRLLRTFLKDFISD